MWLTASLLFTSWKVFKFPLPIIHSLTLLWLELGVVWLVQSVARHDEWQSRGYSLSFKFVLLVGYAGSSREDEILRMSISDISIFF